MKYTKLLIIIAIVGLFVVFYKLGFNKYLSLEALQANKEALNTFYHEHQLVFTGAFMLIYIISVAIYLPGATILTLTGGFIFGHLLGSGIVIVSATIGASLAFLVARFILRNTLEKKYERNLKKFNEGIDFAHEMDAVDPMKLLMTTSETKRYGFGYVNPKKWKNVAGDMFKAGLLEKTPDVRKYYTEKFLSGVMPK